MRISPTAQMPADQTNNRELMQKKLIVCPISSHEPVSVTFKKNVIVMTVNIPVLQSAAVMGWMKAAWKANVLSVRVRATRKRLNGGRSRRALRIEKVMARMIYGETILNICRADLD